MTMLKSRGLAAVFFLLLYAVGVQGAQLIVPSVPQIAATSYILMDATTGTVIAEDNADERLPPASLTKLMTAYIIESELNSGRLSLDDQVPVSVKAWKTGGSRMFIREGTQVAVGDLLKGIVVQSGNDASVAMAEHIAGSEDAFVDIMNQQASLLGMTNTRFQTATGMPHSDQYSSARDIAILSANIINEFPENYPLYAQKEFTYNKITQKNRNKLLWLDSRVDGLKTGYTSRAGYCLAASAKQNDTRLIAVVMGTNSPETRTREAQKLLSYGFRYYETAALAAGDKPLISRQVWGGLSEQISLGVEQDVNLTLTRGTTSDIELVLDIDETIKAPISRGDVLGKLRVVDGDQTLTDRPVIALSDVEQAGLLKRIWDYLCLFLGSLFS